MIKGFRGKLLYINLTKQEIAKIPLNEDIAKNFLGGAGYAVRYLYDTLNKDTDPLSSENILMIMTGPLMGTFAPNTGRWVYFAIFLAVDIIVFVLVRTLTQQMAMIGKILNWFPIAIILSFVCIAWGVFQIVLLVIHGVNLIILP